MTFTPSVYGRIKLSSFEPSAASPDVADDFRGLVIAGPEAIVLAEGDDTPFPVCGTYQVSAEFFNRFHSMPNEIVLVAVRGDTHAPYASNLLRRDFTAAPGRFDPSDPGFANTVMTGWFNVDLFRWMPELPRRAGRHTVFALLGSVTSNAITVEISTP